MCLDANLTNHVSVNTTAATPVMAYTEEDDERNCMDVIEEEFVKRYPITARRHDLIQLKQQRGQLLTTFINNLMMLGSEANVWELKPEDWMAILTIAGVVDEEAKKEFMKIENPNMTKIRKAANAYEKEANSAKLRPDTSKAYQIKNSGSKEVICFVCGNKGHKSGECTLKQDNLKCNNCKRIGHLAKAYQSKPDSGLQQKDRRRDKARVAK